MWENLLHQIAQAITVFEKLNAWIAFAKANGIRPGFRNVVQAYRDVPGAKAVINPYLIAGARLMILIAASSYLLPQ